MWCKTSLRFSVVGLAAFVIQLAGMPARGTAQQAFPQPDAAHEAVVREISGVVAAGSSVLARRNDVERAGEASARVSSLEPVACRG